MPSITELFNYIFIIGAGQGVLLSVFLLRKQENHLANRILGLTIAAFVLDLIMAVYYNSGMFKQYPHFVGLTSGFPYLYGPSVYLYVRLLGKGEGSFRKKYWLHYIPFAFVYGYSIYMFGTSDAAFKIGLVSETIAIPWYVSLVSLLIPAHGCLYTVLTIIAARKFNRRLKDSYSNLDKIKLSWVKFLAFGTATVWGIVLLSYALEMLLQGPKNGYLLIYMAISVFNYSMAYKALRQPEVQLIGSGEESALSEKTEPYKKSGLQEEHARQYCQQLLTLMEEKKPYLNSEIRLADLAGMLNLSTHNISEVINSQLGESFYDFINRYRVEEVKRLIAQGDAEKFNLLSLGYDAGFSSKSAYYAAFKKATGTTPAKYRDTLQEQ